MIAKKLQFKNSRPLKYFIFRLTCVVIAVMLTSCEQNPTAPNEPPKPPGYQEDIYWPSLADSPWPMNHHDPQSTGRSKYFGPKFGQIDWKLDSVYMESAASIATDGKIYFVSEDKPGLFAVNQDGTIDWILIDGITLGDVKTTPLIASGSNLYISGGFSGRFYSINTNGIINWEIDTGVSIDQVGLNIGKDGKIYFVGFDNLFNSKLFCINPSGFIEWVYENNDILSSAAPGTSFSPDGKTLFIPGKGRSILALDIETQSVKWSFGKSKLRCTPTIDSNGYIYFVSYLDTINSGNFSIFCLKPDGSIRWDYDLGFPGSISDSFYYLEGTLDREGNYYFATNELFSLDYFGNLRWKLLLSETEVSGSSLVCDIDGNIYLNVGAFSKYYSISKEGKVNWIVNLENQFSGFSPAISSNKKLIIPTFKSKYFFSIK